MRILIVTDTFFPDVNGVAKTLNTLAMGLALKGHEIEVVTPASGQASQLTHRPITIHPTANFPLLGYPSLRWGYKSLPSWIEFLERFRPHVMYIAVESLLGLMAMKAAKQLSIPVISGFHTKFHQYAENYGLPWLKHLTVQYLRYFHDLADLTLVPSMKMKEELESLQFSNLQVLGRGVDTQQFHPRHRCEKLRASWGVGDKEPVMLSVGRVAAEKNLELFFKVYERLKLLRSDLRAVVVGDGPKRKEYQAKYPEILFTGAQYGDDLSKYYANGDLFVFPSLTETFGNVLLEAMASGLVVISFKDAAAEQWIDSGTNGFLAEHSDASTFLRQCEVALKHWKNSQLRSRARLSVKDQHWDRIIEAFEMALKRLASKSFPRKFSKSDSYEKETSF